MAQVRTRKRGKTWSYIFEAGQVNGKRKVIEKGSYPTKDTAYKAGVEKYTSFMHGDIGITSEAITLTAILRHISKCRRMPLKILAYSRDDVN